MSFSLLNTRGATKSEKSRMIDGLMATTGYTRKYAIQLLSGQRAVGDNKSRTRRKIYGEDVRQALVTIWYASNLLCSKRLVPFLPVLIESLERHGHLHLTDLVRERLLEISPATVDRLLSKERKESRRSISTTRSGALLKKQIKVRTFADWCESIPGFFEVDLVAHCGGNVSGSFLNTLVLTDIQTGWIECIPLLQKSAEAVIQGLDVVRSVVPFPILGLDSDNGSEFINHQVFRYCEVNEITFTRSRSYRKNDQAHVEEKNGSVVRRLVGYDRYEGRAALLALTELYSTVRQYVNYFQPSMKLASKYRMGAKTVKRYDQPKTPLQRLLESGQLNETTTKLHMDRFHHMDPIALLNDLRLKQDRFWSLAWQPEELETTESKSHIERDSK